MFLGQQEMRHDKLRYSLLTGIILLIALVVFMLSGLASGLSRGNRLAIDQWPATTVILNRDANKSLSASTLSTTDLTHLTAQAKAPLSLLNAAVHRPHQSTRTNISLLGTSARSFLLPKVNHGHRLTGNHQVIISQDLAAKGYRLGQKILIGKTTTPVKIVGIYGNSTYSMQPTLYTTMPTFAALKGGPDTAINAIVAAKVTQVTATDRLQSLSKATFINNLPGYHAEQLTLTTMIDFLLVIALAVIGIFMYVMTLQKRSLFAVLKVQGIPTRQLIASVVTQGSLIGLLGVVFGLVITLGLSHLMPAGMPFYLQPSQLVVDSLSLWIAVILGSLLSFRTVTHIDPVSAIS